MKHVIVVEDDAVNAVLFRRVLERRGGFRVTVTEDVAELMRLARAGEADAVVMDVSLTDSHWEGQAVNGVEICRLIKQDPRTAAIPVVLATAHAMRGDAEKLLGESGADDYVSKPLLDHEAFVAQLRRWVERAA